jgi:NAD(P)-dependent dehydrogenase (short-subunit alcohol dehydrogenase family)
VIVEERTYHVSPASSRRPCASTPRRAPSCSSAILGNLIGAFTVDIGDLSSIVQLWGYDDFAERERRRAELQADEPWKAFLRRLTPLIHTQRAASSCPRLLPDPMSALDGRVAIVTGGAQGIGRAIADGLAAEGARIVIADLRGREEAAARYPDGVGLTWTSPRRPTRRGWPRRRGPLRADRHPRQQRRALRLAGHAAVRPDRRRRVAPVMDVNVMSMFLTCRAVVPHMREQGGGRIVNISSGTPFRGVPFLLHYVTSKGAIVAFTRALAKELGGDEVLVNCVAPGLHDERGRQGERGGRQGAARRVARPRGRSSATRSPRTSWAPSCSCAARARRS